MRRINPALTQALKDAEAVALIGHVSPDGDTIGSCLALSMGLTQLGKRTAVFCADKVPDNLMMLSGAAGVRVRPDSGTHFDTAISVDVSTSQRLGSCMEIMEVTPVRLIIDHHHTNPCDWGQLSEVDGDAPACALLVYQLLLDLGVTVTADMAACLYTAIATDTGNYSYKSTSAEAFAVTAALLETGFDMEALNRRLFRTRPLAQSRLTCRALERMTLHAGGRIACIALTLQDFGDCAALPEHADTLVNLGLQLEGVSMALLSRETASGAVKFSLRALPPYQVDDVAQRFGGGGHQLAAGITFSAGRLDELTAMVLADMEARL